MYILGENCVLDFLNAYMHDYIYMNIFRVIFYIWMDKQRILMLVIFV